MRVGPDDFGPVLSFLMLLDGSRSVDSAATTAGVERADAIEILEQLDQVFLIGEPESTMSLSGTEALLELEDLTTDLLYNTLYQNPYWQAMQDPTDAIPENVLYGTIVENYHFLFRESWFDAPVLSYPYSRGARVSLNEFFAEESGHDELILRSLMRLGHSREDLADTIPLQTTAALCNALAWWSRTDPLFFITTIGILEGRDVAVDSFVLACEKLGIDPLIVGPMRRHAEINLAGGHGNLTRQVFTEIPAVSTQTMRRLRCQTHLFVELYDDFYQGIWDHYCAAPTLLRRITDLTGDHG
jgi:hypothetical protein